MAYVQYKNGKKALIGERQAILWWRIITGRCETNTDKEKAYADKVKSEVQRVVINWTTAPEDYIRANLPNIIPFAVSLWVVDEKGRPLKPSTSRDWDFAKKYGLWRGGKPSTLIDNPQTSLL